MGRFGEALPALPEAMLEPAALEIQARCLWLRGEDDGARDRLGRIAYPDPLDTLRARAEFAQLEGDPAQAAAPIRAYDAAAGRADEHAAWAALLAYWLDSGGAPARPHRALAWLRAHRPARAAEGAALFAEAHLGPAPAAALVWLDQALDQVARFGQHHLQARLLHAKAQALDAAGDLAVASKFQTLARETAQRQEAWRYLTPVAL